MTPAECSVIKMKSHQFIHTCTSCKTDQQKSRRHSVPYLWMPQLLACCCSTHCMCMEIRCICMWNMEWLLCTICSLLGYFFMRAVVFNWKRCCAREASCMEMRAIMNGWTQEGMNGVQEAVDAGWWKWHLAERSAMCLVVARVFSEYQRLQRLNLHFNNHQVSVVITGMLNLELKRSR